MKIEPSIRRLGRFEAKDPRDKQFLLKSTLPVMEASDKPQYKYWWDGGWWGDQGTQPWCVAYSWLHWLEDGPTTHFYEGRSHDPFYMDGWHKSLINPKTVYDECQLIDRWPGNDYDGTSVRAGAKVLMRHGIISGYRWAWDIDTALDALLTRGPLVVGTWWYSNMFSPNSKGFIGPSGNKSGGHAYVVNGVNMNKGFVRIKNSWGRGWGRNGHAYLTFDGFASLIEEGGEVCMADEVSPGA